jgi:hypothetical protein
MTGNVAARVHHALALWLCHLPHALDKLPSESTRVKCDRAEATEEG